ncbi:MAG: acyltransferase [Chloroflexia bacterium]|nr:acyltransferase [Chloroflexia bacterium]
MKDIFYSAEKYARYLGVKIGQNCRIATKNFGSEPFLIEIGNHVHLTWGVSFVNHDGGVWVFREKWPSFDVYGKIKINDNTFIGNNTLILPGIEIGENCIIGASSVVTKSIPPNCVVAGIPAKFIMSTDDYLIKILPFKTNTKGLSIKNKKELILKLNKDQFIIKNTLKTDL